MKLYMVMCKTYMLILLQIWNTKIKIRFQTYKTEEQPVVQESGDDPSSSRVDFSRILFN